LCCHPSLVAIVSSNEALNFWAEKKLLEVKTTGDEKSYKDSGASDLKHRQAKSCGRE
jgi:hypothetical protein